MTSISKYVDIPLAVPPENISVMYVNRPEPYSFRMPQTKNWGLDLWNCRANVEIVDRKMNFTTKPGVITITPPGSHIRARFPRGRVGYFASFSFPENSTTSEQICINFDLGKARLGIGNIFRQALLLGESLAHRQIFYLWNILFELVDLSTPQQPQYGLDPKIEKVIKFINLNLSENINIGQLAKSLGIGPSCLSRLFRKNMGQTVVEYLRKQRCAKAFDLLTHTSLPVKEIAWLVGIPDAQHFNKTIKREFNASPTGLRKS